MSSCRICNSPVEFYANKNGFEVLRCTQCGFGQVDVSPEVLAAFYDKSYFDGEKAGFAQSENEALSPARRYWIETQMEGLRDRGPLSVLEIGPGVGGPIAGYFERERPQDTYAAIEFSEYAAEKLRARGLEVWTGRVVEPEILNACRGKYDFIFATEVIEHDLDPHGFLQAVYQMLKPGGRAAFTTGNLNGWMARRGKADWYYLDPPAHVSYYTPRAAQKSMTDAGFKNFKTQRWGFRHAEAVVKMPAFLQKPVLWLVNLTNASTGMTISAQRR